jgi:histidinol dehydrogenase
MKNTAGGYTIGQKGSVFWHRTAPKAEVSAYYDEFQTYDLCMKWADAHHKGKRDRDRTRSNIAEALKRRGENPLKCYNPTDDRLRDAEARATRAEADARAAQNAARRAKRSAEDAAAADAWFEKQKAAADARYRRR